MATAPADGGWGAGGTEGRRAGPDWVGIEGSPEFRELAARRRRAWSAPLPDAKAARGSVA